MTLWASICKMTRDIYKEVFPQFPCHLIAKEVDDLTSQAIFTLKSKSFSTPRKLSTTELILDDEYFSSLPSSDRKIVAEQYLLELNKPRAYIQEYPLTTDDEDKEIFKILLIEEKKILCGTAAYFVSRKNDVLSKLSVSDVVALTTAYAFDLCKGATSSADVIHKKEKCKVVFLE